MGRMILSAILASGLATAAQAQAPATFADTYLADVARMQVRAEANGQDYTLWIALPPGYATSKRAYPMLLVLDGAWHFPVAASAARYQASDGRSDEVIVVGISTSGSPLDHGVRRLKDYTPPGMTAEGQAGLKTMMKSVFAREGMSAERWDAVAKTDMVGGAGPFLKFIEAELLPMLSRKYRIDRGALGLAGHSASGAFVSYALLKGAPFTRYLVASYGTIWYGDTLPGLEAAFAEAKDDRALIVYETHGQGEVEQFKAYGDPFADSSALLDRLAASRPGRVQVTHHVVPDQRHLGSVPASLTAGIGALFPKPAAAAAGKK